MTQLRKRPRLDYHTLIVCPDPGFDPKDWREKPKNYTVVSYEGPQQLRGRADAWRFQHNQRMLQQGKLDHWAIVCTRLEQLTSEQNVQN